MYTKIIKITGDWIDVLNSARTTVNKKEVNKAPSSKWKRRILLAEHSPIRKLNINFKWFKLPYWVSVHFVRHKFGIEHWVRSQRDDKTNINRDEIFQSAEIEHEVMANPQAIINISRKRLCSNAKEETRIAWINMLKKLEEYEPELVSCCVKDCIYRGYCYEMNSCGYFKSQAYLQELAEYRRGINEQYM